MMPERIKNQFHFNSNKIHTLKGDATSQPHKRKYPVMTIKSHRPDKYVKDVKKIIEADTLFGTKRMMKFLNKNARKLIIKKIIFYYVLF